ncbi:MAG TPA: hypothetical protein VNI01_00535, partial [Elusimicrobiota bacterium]|nr:hypothetical protein [Elusimicrobiota bacterium]
MKREPSEKEGGALALLRSVLNWFYGLDSLAVVFGTCVGTLAVVLLLVQLKPEAPHPAPGGSIFSRPPEDGSAATASAAQAPASSSLDFVPRMPGVPEPPKEAPSQPEPEPAPAAPAPTPVAPSLPVLPVAPPRPTAALVPSTRSSSPNSGGGNFAAGAQMAAPAQEKEKEKAGAIGGQARASSTPPSEPQDGDVVRQMIPLIQQFQANGGVQGYNSGGSQRGYS